MSRVPGSALVPGSTGSQLNRDPRQRHVDSKIAQEPRWDRSRQRRGFGRCYAGARVGVPIVPAFAAAAIFPAASILLSWRRHRRPEFIGIGVLATILTGIAIALLTNDGL